MMSDARLYRVNSAAGVRDSGVGSGSSGQVVQTASTTGGTGGGSSGGTSGESSSGSGSGNSNNNGNVNGGGNGYGNGNNYNNGNGQSYDRYGGCAPLRNISHSNTLLMVPPCSTLQPAHRQAMRASCYCSAREECCLHLPDSSSFA